MSEFWNASQPPKQADIVAWCEAEVETACKDLMSCTKLVAGWTPDGWDSERGLPLHVLFGTPWDEAAPDSSIVGVNDMIEYEWRCISTHDGKVHPGDWKRFEAHLNAMEAKIAEVRSKVVLRQVA